MTDLRDSEAKAAEARARMMDRADAATALVDFIGKTHRWNATRTREREKVANVTNDSIRF